MKTNKLECARCAAPIEAVLTAEESVREGGPLACLPLYGPKQHFCSILCAVASESNE